MPPMSPKLKSAWAALISSIGTLKSSWTASSVEMRNPKDASLIGAFVLAVAFVVTVCCLYPPIWETNDDVAMAMVAHGYGIAAVGTPNLFFSNVLWGYLVRLIPTLAGVDGYSIATLGVLVIVGTVVIYALRRFGLGVLACASALFLIFLRAVLTPQFTVNAGLLTVAAVLCWQVYGSTGKRGSLVAGCLLGYLGYLVRDLEFALVLFVALPLLPWRALFAGRAGKAAMAVFAVAVVTSAFVDHMAYQTPEWRYYNELNRARAPFTDFRAAEAVVQRPDILKRHGYSFNDIDLVEHWFFVDPKLIDPQALSQMFRELGPLPVAANARWYVSISVSELWTRLLLPAVVTALLLALILPSWRLFASWGIFFSAVVAMGLIGRPGVLRIYIPPVCLLLIAPLILGANPGVRRHLAAGLLLVAAAVNCFHVTSDAGNRDKQSENVQEGLKGFPTEPVVIWGGAFPFQWTYPLLGTSSAARSYELYGLGVFTWTPFSRSYAEQAAGRGLVTRLLSAQGVPMVATDDAYHYLDLYCREHFRGQLERLSHHSYGVVDVNQMHCKMSP